MPPPPRRPKGTPNGAVIEPRWECARPRGRRLVCQGHVIWWNDAPYCPWCREPRRRAGDTRATHPGGEA